MTRSRPTHGTIVAYVALFVALGGTGYAIKRLDGGEIAKRTIPGNRLEKNGVGSKEVKGLLAKDFEAGQLPAGSDGAPGPPAANALLGNTVVPLSIIANEKLAPSGPTTPISATTAGNEQRSPNATIVARDLSVGLTTAPGGATSRTFTLVDDGALTPVSCTIAGSQTSCDSGSATATISAGSTLHIQASLTVSPPSATSAELGLAGHHPVANLA